jgi:hypothetical protein
VNPTWPLRDALELARSILDEKVGIIEGSIILAKYAHEVVPDWRIDPDFVVCGALASSTDHLPFGAVRERWSSTASEKVDAEIAAITESHRAEIRRACENIIARFGPGKRTVTLFRPIGPSEYELIAASGWRKFPHVFPTSQSFTP